MSATQTNLPGTRQPFAGHNQAALALLSRAVQAGANLDRKEASFLGSCAGLAEITPRMRWWLSKLLNEAELPAIED